MLLEIKKQKNGTILLTAPDGTVQVHKPGKGPKAKVAAEIGDAVLELLDAASETPKGADPEEATDGELSDEEQQRRIDAALSSCG